MENTTIKKFKIERTKTGLPARWEYGGGCSNTGESSIVAGANGQPKKPVYVKRSGHLSNSRHALIVVESGDYIITAYHHRRDFTIKIFRIMDIDGEYAITELVYKFSGGEWNETPPADLQPAIKAATEKSTCYHCRSAHYISE